MQQFVQNIVFIGGGNMASAILGGVRQQGVAAQQITVVDPGLEARLRLQERYGVRALEAALQASPARQEATRIGQATGERTVLDVLHADNDPAPPTLALAQARSRLLLAQLQLAQLAGTLDEAALQQANQAFAQAPKP